MLLKNSEALQKGESMEFFAMLCNFEVLNFFHFSLLGQLLSFTDQLFQGQPCGELKWSIPSSTESGMSACPFSMHSTTGPIRTISDSGSGNICIPALPESRSTVSISSQVAGQQPTSEQDQQQHQQTKG